MRRLAPLALVLLAASCSHPARERAANAAAASIEPAPATEAASVSPIRQVAVTLYYPAADADALIGEQHEIFETASPGDRIKQIVADLIAGPSTDRAARALPSGTLLRQAYVLEDGTAWLDFSAELRDGLGGGSAHELLAVYAIVDSVALNIPSVRRVGILIGGDPIDTLNGHVDLVEPLPANRTLIVRNQAPAEAAAP